MLNIAFNFKIGGIILATLFTFYLSRILGNEILSETNIALGKIADLIVDVSTIRPKVIGAKIRTNNQFKIVDFSNFCITKEKRSVCNKM
jgi:sporulation protein YlmC with PRC-barrel domain